MKLVNDLSESLKQVSGDLEERVANKLVMVLNKNPSYKTLVSIKNYLDGSCVELPQEIASGDVANFKYCPVTSVDVERSFSAYKLILTDKRRNLTPIHLEQMVVTYCYEIFSQNT